MDNLKFRAWSEDVKKFTYFGDGERAIITETQFEKGSKWGMFLTAPRGTVYLTKYSDPEQYIGKKDKRENEIYAGDIVRLHFFREPEWAEGEVEWDYIGEIKFQNGAFWFIGRGLHDCCWFQYNQDEIEVIGNIHENPTLLLEGVTSCPK